MSGTFEDIDVPPTLVSFAVDVAKERDIITPELKKAGSKLVWITDSKGMSMIFRYYEKLMDQFMRSSQRQCMQVRYYLHMHWIVTV